MDTPQARSIDWKSIATDKCRLSVYLHPQFSGYAVTGISDHHLYHLDGNFMDEKAPLSDLPARQWLQTYHSLLDIPFEEVHIGVYSNKFILLPDIGIRNDLALAQMCEIDSALETIFTDKIDQEVSLHYAIPKIVFQLLADHFSRKTIHFGEAGWIKKILRSAGTKVSAHMVGSDLLVAATEDGLLRYLNRFEAINAEEILYYILLVYKVLGYETNSVRLDLNGFIETLSPIYKLLYGYIAHLEMGDDERSNTDIHQPDVSTHYYTNLLYL